ncbi:1,6-anhydro-N-acetylmuramyl-L-alanine amidase AmpD [Denitromonas iodatirespirans]|uniref:1,6-anhydro-N-acetylmuramyl-L-alanine amidase AmpD n=1 Tax=Denitromonas iodatirespirans TaxID=2795389 RepID=A0A944D8V7_DENI1|nr:1,6-anhydro-N-acetylmuramyl-L-alanine amidase AmpD [Denitromonas iodatirespirans]MBT0962099.1 1,6-anhydro-N-acetylmuramyl-L-alanine amidase AmpD [Denitromonas iodatirespirans]
MRRLDAAGWLDGARWIASPNFDLRPTDTAIRLLVVHAISLPPEQFGGPGVLELFGNRIDPAAHPYYAGIAHLRVSAHFFIRRDGELIQCVPTRARAWHAGLSRWRECERCNDFSIGVELEGSDNQPFTDAQYTQLNALIADLARQHPLDDVVGHSDIAPGRKTDPGPCFDWSQVAALPGR